MAKRSGFLTLASLLVALLGLPIDPARATEAGNKLAANKLAANKLAANKLAANRLAANKLAANKLAANRLAANRLAANRLAGAQLLATPDGRELYSYIISCALPESLAIEVAIPSAADTAPPDTHYACTDELCVFEGGLGLAEHWLDRPLDPKGQRWVSACLLARVNAHGVAQTVSLRGLAPSLSVSAEEEESHPVEEGAFYGNVFTRGEDPIDWNACRGEGQAAGELGGLELRDCAEEDPENPGFTYCGFEYAGDCADFTPDGSGDPACEDFDDEEGFYGKCHAGASSEDGSHAPYREVITTYTEE